MFDSISLSGFSGGKPSVSTVSCEAWLHKAAIAHVAILSNEFLRRHKVATFPHNNAFVFPRSSKVSGVVDHRHIGHSKPRAVSFAAETDTVSALCPFKAVSQKVDVLSSLSTVKWTTNRFVRKTLSVFCCSRRVCRTDLFLCGLVPTSMLLHLRKVAALTVTGTNISTLFRKNRVSSGLTPPVFAFGQSFGKIISDSTRGIVLVRKRVEVQLGGGA